MVSYVDVRRRIAHVRAEVWAAVGCGAALLVYGNATSVVEHDTRERFLLWSNLGAMALLLAWALLGLALSAVAALPPVLFILLAPMFNDGPVEAPEITERSGPSLVYFLTFRQPVGTALFEEVAFRGVLYAAWRRAGGDRTAIVVSSAFFAAWHAVITSRTVAESGVVDGAPLVALGVAVSLAGLFAGDLIFAYMRRRTGSIAAAVVAHWLVVAAMSLAVWATA